MSTYLLRTLALLVLATSLVVAKAEQPLPQPVDVPVDVAIDRSGAVVEADVQMELPAATSARR